MTANDAPEVAVIAKALAEWSNARPWESRHPNNREHWLKRARIAYAAMFPVLKMKEAVLPVEMRCALLEARDLLEQGIERHRPYAEDEFVEDAKTWLAEWDVLFERSRATLDLFLTVETEDEYSSEKCVGEGGHFWVFEPPSEPGAADAHYACERCVATGSHDLVAEVDERPAHGGHLAGHRCQGANR